MGTVEDYLRMLQKMRELEQKGEITVHHVTEEYQPVNVTTLSGRLKKIPTVKLWQHKSCGQCGHIPGYVSSLYWIMSELNVPYIDDTNQTSCTAWNYYGSGTSNSVALTAVFLRNMHVAWEKRAYPLIHCGTSYGDYKECRFLLITNSEIRERVRAILKKIDRDIVVPEELVHYSEWLHVMRFEIAQRKKFDVSQVKVAVHAACHTYKLMAEDFTYDESVLGGVKPAPTSSIALALGAKLVEYSNWYDCCGFGFRHILTEREISRSFAYFRKIRPIVNETRADVLLTHDTGCVTTLDKSQVVPLAHGYKESIPVLSDSQFAALAMGAHPFLVCQLHWHVTDWSALLSKMGIDWQKAKEEYKAYLERVKKGEKPYLIKPPPFG
ncbi:heterodisulfide reductase subunit B [Candidatus Marsarchaeota G2 archaeon ECH_B_SAG-G16]|uniref:Heterodisulfide reductase subunit B n=5 Tax=Candidatus Marsarchaeota TaxID=1978152 RepID=A0A2R6AGB7_9ARCH|nr:MAG: heterodisulfide reductase subunit B [Candidatus Marsarchaeota G1 archaeon OSP_D]PSN85434.1 MAG: heterodisulfide reductase subunit B [Candidatus Marsarchaeota G1 archaeon BE_D]PSN88184.1 MAG: heterodisulfide reductase subunit B [Candidatus Marsarchaeota G1 archaeon OSP_C]PSO04993.1 MAG: heterodisulfide reductase subunit B [Candidatus Marsarchaeota G2 archaeon ECH_B_SAG-G16]